MIIKGKGFVLRPYRKGDEEFLRSNINNKNVSKFMCNVPYPYTKKDAKEFVDKCIKDYKSKKKNKINWTIDIKGKTIGGIGFSEIIGHKGEIGYWLSQKHWGEGIMTNAMKLVVNYGFNDLKLHRIYAHVFLKNTISARVLEKNGFKKEGLIKKHTIKNKKFIDCYLYAKTK